MHNNLEAANVHLAIGWTRQSTSKDIVPQLKLWISLCRKRVPLQGQILHHHRGAVSKQWGSSWSELLFDHLEALVDGIVPLQNVRGPQGQFQTIIINKKN